MTLTMAVVVDYQNVHLTAHDVFDRHGGKHEALIHPRRFAEVAIRRRNKTQRDGHPAALLKEVIAFRGLPHSHYDWEQNRRCSAQARQWRLDGATVVLRDLKYSFKLTAEGTPDMDTCGHKVPTGPGREKGVDVLVALTCLRRALLPDVDLVILASRDTDLVPVLNTLIDMRREDPAVAKVETVSWFNRNARREGNLPGGSLRPDRGRRVWNTNLDRRCFEASLDRNDYS